MAAEHRATWQEPGLGMRLGGWQRVRKSIDGQVAGGLFPALGQGLQDRDHGA